MRFTQLNAIAFGPFSDQEWQFSPGMTVIHGANEAGKSSLHAALYTALCGMKRGRGSGNQADRQLRDRFKPWDQDQWEVSVRLQLDDGRTIEIRQDLLGKVGCSAHDTVLGADLTAEIMFDGSPDGSRWLGLNRKTFEAVACVRQAEVLAIQGSASALQEDLQRAAAGLSQDHTAAEARSRIDEFRRESIGISTTAGNKPLAAANAAIKLAEKALDSARIGHVEYLASIARSKELEEAADEARLNLACAEAAEANRELKRAEDRLAEIRVLTQQQEEATSPIASITEDIQVVAEALTVWKGVTVPAPLTGETAASIQEKLDLLPGATDGDDEVHPSVADAREAVIRAEGRLESHREQRAKDPGPQSPSVLTPAELDQVAQILEDPEPTIDPKVIETRDRARAEVENSSTKRVNWPFVTVGVLALAASVGLFLLFRNLFGSAVAFVGGILLIGAGLPKTDHDRLEDAEEDLGDAEEAYASANLARQAWNERIQKAREKLEYAALPDSAEILRSLSDSMRRREALVEALQTWTEANQRYDAELDTALAGLRSALLARGAAVGEDALAAFDEYVRACKQRSGLNKKSAERENLEALLAQRLTQEADYAKQVQTRTEAGECLCVIAHKFNVPNETPEEAEIELNKWQFAAKERLAAAETSTRDSGRLTELLAGRKVEEVAAEVEAMATKARALLDALPGGAVSLFALDENASIASLRASCSAAERAASDAAGECRAKSEGFVSVAEAEEVLEVAKAERDRLEKVSLILDKAMSYLAAAEDRVHRDIAPRLATSVNRRLNSVTSGRYREVRVDPANLAVQVIDKNGRSRPAMNLSHGTAEQIYLLLRVALAEHLVTNGESCPLLLDDVTVHFDALRKVAFLNTVKSLADERQVILFTQEEQVVRWADASLSFPRHSVIRLPSPTEMVVAGLRE